MFLKIYEVIVWQKNSTRTKNEILLKQSVSKNVTKQEINHEIEISL